MAGTLTFTVHDLNQYVKKLLDFEHSLKSIKVRGEISNYTVSRAGHVYFTLKDEDAQIRCTYFNAKDQQTLDVKNGDSVIVQGNVSLYVKGGDYQLNVKSISYAGIGYWYERFHAIKDKLEREGLFDDTHKKLLPAYPHTIGVVTSPTGAAIRDIQRVINARYPLAKILLYPVPVQGAGAHRQIARAIQYFSESNKCDILIVGRGGGSVEDLWEFNEEKVARAIYSCSVPVISAVGHERDFAISDFVADVREATPSTAAARAVPDMMDIFTQLNTHQQQMLRILQQKHQELAQTLDYLTVRIERTQPDQIIQRLQQNLNTLTMRLHQTILSAWNNTAQRLQMHTNALHAYNPHLPLQRGYMMATDTDGDIVPSIERLQQVRTATLHARDGQIPIMILPEENER